MYNSFPLAILGCERDSIPLAKVLQVFIFKWYSIAMYNNFPLAFLGCKRAGRGCSYMGGGMWGALYVEWRGMGAAPSPLCATI